MSKPTETDGNCEKSSKCQEVGRSKTKYTILEDQIDFSLAIFVLHIDSVKYNKLFELLWQLEIYLCAKKTVCLYFDQLSTGRRMRAQNSSLLKYVSVHI